MRQTAAISLQLTGQEQYAATGTWVHLEQKEDDKSPFANLSDIDQMIARAMGGLTAHSYNLDRCRYDITPETIEVPIDLYVWPSSLDLNYSLRAFKGEEALGADVVRIDPGRRVEVPREDSHTLSDTSMINFDYLVKLGLLHWETGCYSAANEVIVTPGHEVEGNRILLDAHVYFGVARASVRAVGYLHRITLIYDNSAAGAAEIKNSVSASEITIKAVYEGVTDKESVEDVTPGANASSCLPQCPDGNLIGGRTVVDPDEERPLQADVYYSICSRSKSVLDVHTHR